MDGALTAAHAVWPCRCSPSGGPKERALTRSLRDLTSVREIGQ